MSSSAATATPFTRLFPAAARTLAKYAKVFEIGLQNTFVYRWNFILRSLFALVPILGTVFIWKAVFQSRGAEIGGYDFARMIYYFMLILLVENLVTPTDDEWQIANDIREGQINSFLSKPLNYFGYRLMLFASTRIVYTLLTCLPLIGIFLWFREFITLPANPLTWLWATLALLQAAALQFLIAYSLALLAFWILEISTIVFILYSFEYFLSGRMFPIDIMPGWIVSIMEWLPFPYELYFPVSVFMEEITGDRLCRGLAIQAGWVILMGAVATLLWRRGIRKYQAVGG